MRPGDVPSARRGVGAGKVLGILAVVLAIFSLAGWFTYRSAAKSVKTVTRVDRSPQPPAVVEPATKPESVAQPRTEPAPTSTDSAEQTKEEKDEPPTPEHGADASQKSLDDFVKQEAPRYEVVQPPGAKLESISTRDGHRDPSKVAAEIDRLIYVRLAEAKIPSSPKSDDAEFLRRVSLDLTGSVPSLAKTKAFLADKDPAKRDRVIDELLADPAFGDHSAHYWHELIVKRDPEQNRTLLTHDVFVKWLTRQFNQNHGWDQIVRTMLTAQGDQALAGETFFLLANNENGQVMPGKIVGTAAALFLGNQLMCAECHLHPNIPDWKQQDFWGLAAFFGKTKAVRPGTPKVPNSVLARVEDSSSGGGKGKKGGTGDGMGTLADGSIPIPDPRNDGKVIGAAKAKLFGDGNKAMTGSSVNRGTAADWFVSSKNPFFPRATVNRLWARLFARGLINPLDDIRPDSKATHPELLQLLSEEMVAAKFDVKHLTRCICRSEAYQRSSKTSADNETDEDLYSHMPVKVITPRDLFTSLAVVTDNRVRIAESRRSGKKDKSDSTEGFAFFDTREYDESPAEYTYTVPQLLKLFNSTLPGACEGVAESLGTSQGQAATIDHLYLLALGRHPSSAETSKMVGFLSKQSSPTRGYASALWVLLGSAEFMNNH